MSSQPDKNSMANEAVSEVARIARVPEANQTDFGRLLGSAIKRAHSENSRPGGENISAGAITRDFFDPIVRASKKLRVELEGLQGERGAGEKAARSMAASHFFSEALLNVLPDAEGSGRAARIPNGQIPPHVRLLPALAGARPPSSKPS